MGCVAPVLILRTPRPAYRGPDTTTEKEAPVPLWIAVPADQKRAALSALIDAGITIRTTREGPGPSDTPPTRDPGQTFLSVAFGLSFLGLGAWGLWEGGWWIIPAILSALLGLICISASLARPKNQKPTGEPGEVSSA